jgi:hypothetical protein
MPWTLKLPSAITLKDGRVLATLDDARALIRALRRAGATKNGITQWG